MKKNNFTVIFIIILGLLFYLLTACSTNSVESGNGKIIFLVGKVILNNVQAKIGDAIMPDSKIITEENSSCDIVFSDKNIIHIGEKSDVVLNITEKLKKIKLNSGFIVNILKNLEKLANSMLTSYTVETSTAVAGVRGTSFFVKVEDPNNTYICDCNGIIETQNINGSEKKQIAAKHHQAVRFTKTEKGIILGSAPMLYHTDQDLEALASKINVNINWTKIDNSNK